jgi:hypothetical protein
MITGYTNLPPTDSNKNATVLGFENYQNLPMGVDPTVYAAVVGFFASRGFEDVAAELISETIIIQAKQDGYNPMQILDSLRGLDQVDISGLVAEILNYNRFKTSSLGIYQVDITNTEIARNILA